MDPLFEIRIDLSAIGSSTRSQALCNQLRSAICDGRLAPGARLPATRRAGDFFGVSRNTATAAYEQLLSEGYLTTRHGSGTFVAERIPSPSRETRSRNDAAPRPYPVNDFWLRADVTRAMDYWQVHAEDPSPSSARPSVDMRPALVDSRLFPFEVFRRVSARQLRGLERKPASYRSPHGNQGNFSLRAAIARHLAVARAVVCDSTEIIVTAGAQQAFDLLARVLVTPGRTVVAVEDPGYPPMRVPFAAAGARLVAVGVDDEGLIVEQLPHDAGIISLCPSHQFPVGVTLSMRRRKALIAFAHTVGAVIVEDDYDGEFRFEGSPHGALRAPESSDLVFYVGTFSKCMLPALRLGFVIAPSWAIKALVSAKNCLDWHCSTPLQLAVARFISEGHLTRHVRRMREIYRARRRHLLQTLEDELGDSFVPLASFYGTHLTAVPRAGVDLEALVASLLRSNVKLHTLERYHLDQPTSTGLVLGYGAVGLPEISRGLTLLREALPANGRGEA
jgi:GntR family transcriptional regulator/MocR family aminotransferase